MLSVTVNAQFGERITINVDHFGSAEICTGDLNADGLPDVLVSTAFNIQTIDAYLNIGDGTFSERQVLLSNTLTMHYDLACADLDADGDVEVIWAAVNHGLFYHDNLSIVSSLNEAELTSETYFNAFPNPANAQLSITLSPAAEALQKPSMLIFNMNGQWMMEELILDQHKAVYDLSHLSTGQYLIELRAEGVLLQRELLMVE